MENDIKLVTEDVELKQGPEYSLSVEKGQLVVEGEVEIDDQIGTIELRFDNKGLSNQLRDLAEQLDHPEITKCRIGTCLGCSGVVDEWGKLGNLCRNCGLMRTEKGVLIKV